ncbi:hypothetical protein B0H19DRAFT_1134146 [Mycena capillaripes]|nr:hypothetical protein B0H19DRAFT_1134146 [Mycena capillaripes]
MQRCILRHSGTARRVGRLVPVLKTHCLLDNGRTKDISISTPSLWLFGVSQRLDECPRGAHRTAYTPHSSGSRAEYISVRQSLCLGCFAKSPPCAHRTSEAIPARSDPAHSPMPCRAGAVDASAEPVTRARYPWASEVSTRRATGAGARGESPARFHATPTRPSPPWSPSQSPSPLSHPLTTPGALVITCSAMFGNPTSRNGTGT